MQPLATTLGQAVSRATGVKAPMGADQLTDNQRKAVAYTFARLKMITPQQYDLLMPDDKTEGLVKKEFTPHLMNFHKDQIDIGLDAFHRLRQQGDSDYRFLDIDKIVGLIITGGKAPSEVSRAGMYTEFKDRDEPKQLTDEKQVHRRRKVASSEIDNMKSMLGL